MGAIVVIYVTNITHICVKPKFICNPIEIYLSYEV